MHYVDGCAIKPVPYTVDSRTRTVKKPDGSTAAPDEIEEQDKKVDKYHQKDSLIKQQIFTTITDHILLHVQRLDGASKMWAEICKIHKTKTDLVQIDL